MIGVAGFSWVATERTRWKTGREKLGQQTSSSARVNRCFRMTTLSHLELVSCKVDGSSSSQSASLLKIVYERT